MSTHHTTDMLQLFIEILSPLIALVAGIFAYRFMNPFFRLLFAQLIVWLVFYGFGYLITIWQATQEKSADNQWLMNIHLILESGLLIAAARIAFPSNVAKRQFSVAKSLAAWAYGLVLIVFLVSGFWWGFTVYLNLVDLTACIVLMLLYLRLFYRFSRDPRGRFPERTACFGLLLYFAGSVPYVLSMYYVRDNDPEYDSSLYHWINDILANIRYVSLALAFWLLRRNALLLNRKL